MKKLTCEILQALLQKLTPFSAFPLSETRWSSACCMLQCYVALRALSFKLDDENVVVLLSSLSKERNIDKVIAFMTELELIQLDLEKKHLYCLMCVNNLRKLSRSLKI